jgi:hypothetical protein
MMGKEWLVGGTYILMSATIVADLMMARTAIDSNSA